MPDANVASMLGSQKDHVELLGIQHREDMPALLPHDDYGNRALLYQ